MRLILVFLCFCLPLFGNYTITHGSSGRVYNNSNKSILLNILPTTTTTMAIQSCAAASAATRSGRVAPMPCQTASRFSTSSSRRCVVVRAEKEDEPKLDFKANNRSVRFFFYPSLVIFFFG